MDTIEKWNVENSKELYGTENWGAGYFNINNEGNVSVTPKGKNGPAIDLAKLLSLIHI